MKEVLTGIIEAQCALPKTNGSLRIEPCQPQDGSSCPQLTDPEICKLGLTRNPDTRALQCPLQRGPIVLVSGNGAEK